MKGEALSWPCDECGVVKVAVPGDICDRCENDLTSGER
jgi:hypothetical protein